jgi:hypothetical protein
MTSKDSRTTRGANAQQPDALDLMRSELRAVRSLLAQYQSSRSKAIVQEICRVLIVHSQLELEIVYPELTRAFHDKALIPRARAQQATLRALIAEVEGSDPTKAMKQTSG